ncbi:hypothetical protein [Pseudomonas sp. OIL-1]|uniref:hypothetical protein n=1 Tax=Pseudomonas sp. OIL-1 TaxID=2706126 RepID=UPI0013A762A7|nr:hypothetical protein [Pseudomonas sp. OIL-1]QIB51986.1 hypothetical protein G3M63_13565 [Pseudomonas sp. OIL-1]
MRDHHKTARPRLVAGTEARAPLPSVTDWDGYGCADAMYQAEARKYARYAVLRGKTRMSDAITEVIGEQRARRLIADAMEELCAFESSAEAFVGYSA